MSTVRLREELSYEDAVRVLGFEPGVIVSPHLPAFREVEGKLCQLIETTKDEQLQTDFREELARLNQALRVVEAQKDREPPIVAHGMGTRLLVSLIMVAAIVGAAWYVNRILLEDRSTKAARAVETLAVQGRIAVESRDWSKAEAIYEQIETLAPGSPRARDGFLSIAEGKEAARTQKIGFLLGSAQSAIEQRNWGEAEMRAKELLEMVPNHEDAPNLFKSIEEGRVQDKVVGLLERAEEALQDENWEVLAQRTGDLAELAPDHPKLALLESESARGLEILEERRVKARELYEKALALDNGDYTAEGLEALREAIRLADHPDFQALYRKMSSYTRVIEVPGDYETIAEAVADARNNDKVRVGEGTFEAALTLDKKVNLEGAGTDKTIIECDAKAASVILASSAASGSRVAAMTLRQRGIDLTEERYPVVAVDGCEFNLEDCAVENGSGHGVAVINGGTGRLRNVRVVKCGWDGLAVYGENSMAEVSDSRFEANFHHGIDSWGGGRLDVSQSRTTLNGLGGVVIMSPGVKSRIVQTTSDRNREVGIMVANGSQAVLRSNRAEGNLLGGFLVQGEGTTASLEGNVAEKNSKVGIVIDKRSRVEPFEDNVSRENAGEQLQLEAVLPEEVVPPPPLLEIPKVEPVEVSGAPRAER